MNTRLLKTIGAVAVGFVLALAGGWVWGASGRFELQSRLEQTDLRLQTAEARAMLLAARVDLYTLNFGAAAQNLESAKVPLEAVLGSYERDGQAARATDARAALTAIEEARTLAAQVDQSAQGAAARALAAFERATAPQK